MIFMFIGSCKGTSQRFVLIPGQKQVIAYSGVNESPTVQKG